MWQTSGGVAPRTKPKGVPKRLLLGAGLAVLALGGGLAFVFGRPPQTEDVEQEVTAAEREILLTLDKMNLPEDSGADPAAGKLLKIRRPDGGYRVEYAYGAPESPKDAIRIRCSVTVEDSPSAARAAYMKLQLGKGGVLAVDGRELRAKPADLLKWGEESKCVLLTENGKEVGNWFAARKGSRTFSLLLTGLYYDDASFRETLAPILERVEAYRP